MIKNFLFVLLMLLLFPFVYVQAQEAELAEKAFISFLAGNVDVDYTPDNEMEDFEIAELDMRLPAGSIIRTGKNGLCEITVPDGSTIKISPRTVFQIEEFTFDPEMGKKKGRFNLIFGRVRAKVSKLVTTDSEFQIKAGTALAGVRGTTFGVFFDGKTAQVVVFEGSINLNSATGAFETLTISEGQAGTVLSDGLAGPIIEIPDELVEEWEQELQKFPEETEEIVGETAKAEKPKKVAKKVKKAGKGIGLFGENFTMTGTLGSLAVDNVFYNRWVFIPEYRREKLGVGLYIPAIFAPDKGLFDFNAWENHDEWNFTDFEDALHDLLIKIYYVSWGSMSDPLYFKLGNIDNFFLGHGFIVDNYSNMLYFPEELNTGFQFNVDGDWVGIETIVPRISSLQTFAGRLYFRPLGKKVPFAIGATGFYDKPKPSRIGWPVGPLGAQTQNSDQLPQILVFGLDAEFPILNLDTFSLKLYADAAKLGYRYPELHPALSGTGVDEGSIEFLDGLGTAFGVMGKIMSIVDYRLEYRYILDYYEPGFINFAWDNRRLGYSQELLNLILAQDDPAYDSRNTAGFLISGGVVLLKKLEIGLGYENYKRVTGAGTEQIDEGQIYVNVMRGLVPKVFGNVTYNRSEDFDNVLNDPLNENTLLEANVFYELSPNFALSLNVKRTYQFDDETGKNEPIESYSISTIFMF